MATKPKVGQIAATKPRFEYVDVDRSQLTGARFYDDSPVVAEAEAPEAPGMLRRIGDTAVQFGQGAVTGVKMMSDIFGANNAVSSGLSDVNQALDGLLSATAQNDKQKIAQIMQEAEGKGWGEQIVAGLKAAGVDPVGLAANALGTSLPTMATMLIPGAGPAAVATRMGAGVAMGAGQGVGAVKGQIYDETKRKWLEARATPEQAEAKAQEAAAYGGENTDQMAIGGVLGMGSVLGAERALGKVLHGASKAGPGMLGRVATSTLAETGTEMLQGGQEKFATNTALNRQGFDVDPMSGVIANATLEGAAASFMGAAAGIPKPAVATAPGIDPAQEAADTIRATEKVPESGALTRAVNAGTEAKAQAVEAGAPVPTQPGAEQTAEAAPEAVDDPVRDQILALPDGARQDALRAYAVLNRPDAAKGVLQLNRKLLDRLLAENAPPPALGERLTDTDMGAMLGGGSMAGRADPLAGALGMNNEAQANSITNVANVAERRPPMPASDAARMLDEASTQGLDLAVAEHPAGGFVLVPPNWVTPDMAAQGEARLNETISRMQQADAAPVERAPRTRTDGVGLDLQADPVLNYLDNLRSVNTPAARAYMRDFDAGRITPADVQQRMQAERGLTPEQRIARAAAEAPAKTDPVADRLARAAAQGMATPAPTDILNPAGEPFKTRMAADLAAKKTPGAAVLPVVDGGFLVRPQEPVNVQDVPQAPEVPQAAPDVSQPGQAPQAVGAQPAGPAAGVPTEGAGAVEAAGVARSKLLAGLDQTGATREMVLDAQLKDAQDRLAQMTAATGILPADRASRLSEINQEISSLNAVRDQARQLDERDRREGSTRSMLQGARQELDAAVRAGAITPEAAQAIASNAKNTGNAADASEAIFAAVDSSATGTASEPTQPQAIQAAPTAGAQAAKNLLPPTDIRTGDKVVVDGERYTVTGPLKDGRQAVGVVASRDADTDPMAGVRQVFLRGDDAVRAKLAADAESSDKPSGSARPAEAPAVGAPLDALQNQAAAPVAQAQAAAKGVANQPITRAQVDSAVQQASSAVGARIDAMSAQDVQKIAARFLPTMGVRVPAGKARIKEAVTSAGPRMNWAAAAAEFGAELSQDSMSALQADLEGRVQEGAGPAMPSTVAEIPPAPATHADPGQAPEVVTPAVVAQSVQKAARNEDTKPSEMRKWLVAEIDKELLQAPDRPDYDEAVKRLGEKDAISMFTGNGPLGKNNETGYITFDVPGDGKYKVRNSVRGLLEFRKNVMASQGFKDSGQKRVKPEQNDGVQGGSGGSMTAIANMIEEGDFEAARDYAEAVGIARLFVSKTPKNRDVLYAEQDGKLREVTYLTAEQKAQWDRFMSDGTLPTPPDTKPQTAPKTAAQEVGPFGPILTQYRGDAQGAIQALTELKDGEAVAALNHPDVGDIDLVWGEAGTGNKDGFGLSKLIKYHPEVLGDLQGFLAKLKKDPKRSGENRVRLVSARGEAAVSLNWQGDRKVWLLTAYEKSAGDGTTMNTADVANRDDTTRPDASAEPSVPQPPEGYKPAGEPFYRGGKQIQGYAPFAPGERVTMKESAGQSGVIESLASPDDSGVFASAVVKFDNGMEQMVQFGKLEAAAAQPDTPKLTPAEAKSLMAWEDLGQKDGVKTHALTFYESQADKDAKRGRMIVAKVSKGDRSATAWMVDGEDKTFGALAQAKKLAEEVGMARAVADGFVEQGAPAPANDRNAFTLQRLNRETGQMEPVTFERGEYVRYTLGGKDQFGDIDGISQARKEFSVDGLWYPFGFAYKAERPAAPKADTVPLSSVIDKVNAKNGQGLTDADRVPEQKPASKTPTVDHHNATMAAVREGKATPEQFQSSFEQVVSNKDAIVAELDTMTKVQLLRDGGPFVQMRYANEKKAVVVDAVYREMVGEYALGESVTYSMGKGAYEAAVRKMVEATDADKLARYVTDRKAAVEEMQARRAAKAAAIENPQTLADFREVLNAKIREGMTRKEAFLTLTPQQRIQYDTLEAESTREARENRKRAQKTEVRAAGQTTAGEIVATKHTRDGYDLFVVKLADRLSKEDYSTVLASAKKLGGWYSAFRGNGAIPGFQFKDKANAEAFLALAGGDTTAAQEQVAQRRDAFEDDRSQTAVERLRAMADKLEEGAAEVEGQQRKTNTARRARFASAAMASAAADKAKAQTMRNIARAIEDGEAKFLDAVRTKSQVDMLTGIVDTAKGAELRAKYPSYADQEKRKGEPPTAETADFADFPSYSAFRSDLATLGRQLLEVDGTKKLGQRLMSVADDVTDAYLEFAKANIQQVSQFGRGDALAEFASKDEAERAIKRSGLTGKAIVLPIKRGQNRVILSPSEAIGRGLWQGDGDKRITLTAEFGAELVEAIGRRGNKQNQLSVPWQFQNAYDRRKALSRIGIETPSEFRAALREFISLKEQAVGNRTRAMELQMVGRKADGLDFFPTSAEVADQMIEAADLSPDMAVLEPSAGMGHLADRIREARAEPDVIEISADRRELLEEKGYTTQAVDDFLDLKPREFYTFGDTFRAPDGAEGIMRGANGNRVRLVNQAGDMVGAGYYDRADLTGIAHNGTASGYDRIIMNPPFSNRRDAEHVRHAYSLLKPGGRIVAIMGEGVFFGQDKKAQDFREWLESVGGTSEKLPEGSFMDPSLPVNTSVNARMVVIDKPATEGGNVAMFRSIRTAKSAQTKLSQDAVEKAVASALNRVVGAPKVQVVAAPADAGIDVPPGVIPKGVTLPDGSVLIFSDSAESVLDVFQTVFHELYHRGSKVRFTSNPDYITKMLEIASKDELVQQEVNAWKNTADGKDKWAEFQERGPMTGERLANFEALAVEEALANMAEKVAMGEVRKPETVIKQIARFIAKVANAWGMNRFALWLNTRSLAESEKFIIETIGMSGGKANEFTNSVLFRSKAEDISARVGDTLKSITVSNVKQRAGFKLTDYLGIGLQALGRRQIVDIYGDLLPLGEYNRLVQQMEADKNEGGAEADQLVTRWSKLDDEGKLADLMHDATLAQIDPAEDFVEGDDKGKYLELRRKYNLLSDEAKKVYADTRDSYKAHHAKVRSAIKERIERSEIKGERKAALLKQMDDEFFKAIKGVYFPLARFGQYAVTVKGPDGKVESVSRAETKAEAEALRSNLLSAFPRDKGFTVGRVMLSKDFIADRDAVGRGFMTELYQVLDQQNMDAAQRAELEDTLGQLYLSSLPDLSWAKHGIHRKGTPGFSQDARRAFAQNMFHGARYLAKLRYSDLMQDELAAMQKHVDDWREVEDFDQNSAQRVVTEMYHRHESLMNPKSNPLSTALTSLGFVFHLGLSPASAMVNLSQTALVAYPIMGAKWGFGKASAALLKASAEAAKGKNDITASLNADERAAYDEAVRAGTIDVTMAHDLAGIAQGEDAGVMWKIRPVMRWASFLFHHAERFNRQVTFVAAYRLAREAGADHKAAFEQATKATYDGHFDYGAANRPRIMQGNVAKVLLLFKQYGQNMVYTLARNAQQAIKGESPEVRAQARKALGGLLATHAAAAGVLGLPMVTTLLAAASMIGGDDDEPWDAKVALQNMLADTLGQKPAEVLAHGLSRLTPWDISGRVGLDRLIFPDVQEGLEGQRLGEAAMAAALGPVAGIGINVLKGLQDMSQGQYARGLESMMPAALRSPIKAIRYESEGVQDKTGVVIKDEVSLAGVAGQFLGFSPSEVRNATEGKSAIYQQDRALGERRQELLTKAARATMAKDAEARAEAMKEIQRFNQKNPTRRITPLNVLQSVRNRQKRIDQAEGGVYLPKNRRDAIQAGRFALAESE